MSESPLFDKTGRHCLRSVQGTEEGLQLLQKIEAGVLKSLSLGDFLRLIGTLDIPLEELLMAIGEARVVFDPD